MGVMSVITNPSTAEVPVRTRIWCTVPMVVCASFACLAQASFASQQYAQDSAPYLWMIACVLVAIPSGLILLARNSYPQAVFWTACLLVVALPYDSLIALMALTSLLARRQGTKVTLRSVLAAATTTIWSQVRDALHPAEASIWHAIFSKPYTGVRYGNTMVMLVDERTIIASAVVVALIAVAIATLAGLHIRSHALARVAEAKAQSANEQVSRLRTTLDNQQLADAIAAEAHDTLAHSLSLLALNASALQAESRKLKAEAEQLGNANVAGMAGKIAGTTEDIRRQASGALDEAHSVIDMLRHPEDARLQLAANDAEASLTRDSLLQLIGDARAANMRIDTWIDVQQLGQLDESIGVIDDDPMICQMMRLILEDYSSGRISVAFACTNAADAIEHASHNPPDVVLADIAMPGMDGIEATRQLRMLPDPPHVLILTSLSPNNTVERAIEAGAEGFVSKTDAPEDIIRRVADVCEGEPQFNPASQRQLIGDLHQHQPQSRRDEARAMLDALPEREREAVILAAEGFTNAEISEKMLISERTVKAHISSAADKLCMGRVQMARLVERADLPPRL